MAVLCTVMKDSFSLRSDCGYKFLSTRLPRSTHLWLQTTDEAKPQCLYLHSRPCCFSTESWQVMCFGSRFSFVKSSLYPAWILVQ